MKKPLFPAWILVSCFGMLLGAITPWATVPDDTFNGTEGGGALVLILGIPAILFAIVLMTTSKRPRPRWALFLCFVAGGLSAFITLYNWITVDDLLNNPFVAASGAAIGWGLILCSLASVSLVLACLFGFVERKKEAVAPAVAV
jgi:predicted membrane channel-forming protein YqfA (hemolysin III family)